MRKIIFILLFCFISMSFNKTEIIYYQSSKEEKMDTSFLQSELNDSTLYLALLYYEVKHPKAVMAQAKLESANYTSSYCKKNNNFLGLYNSSKKRYYKFDHWTDCIQGYKDMVEYKLKDGENYYDFLRRIKYAEDVAYIHKIKEIENGI